MITRHFTHSIVAQKTPLNHSKAQRTKTKKAPFSFQTFDIPRVIQYLRGLIMSFHCRLIRRHLSSVFQWHSFRTSSQCVFGLSESTSPRFYFHFRFFPPAKNGPFPVDVSQFVKGSLRCLSDVRQRKRSFCRKCPFHSIWVSRVMGSSVIITCFTCRANHTFCGPRND